MIATRKYLCQIYVKLPDFKAQCMFREKILLYKPDKFQNTTQQVFKGNFKIPERKERNKMLMDIFQIF